MTEAVYDEKMAMVLLDRLAHLSHILKTDNEGDRFNRSSAQTAHEKSKRKNL